MKNNIYINIWDYASDKFPFQLFIGGRGTGKTYSALNGAVENGSKFIFMRRTANEMDLMIDNQFGEEGANPFKPINRNRGCNLGFKRIVKNLAGIYERINEEGKEIATGAPVGYAVALSTVSTIRGIDFSECTDLFYDEFIPEKHVKKLKSEGTAFLNAYETINRNREIEGRAPMRAWLLANSNDIYNELFKELGIVSDVEKMISKGLQHKYYDNRGLAIHILESSKEFVDKKSDTALYRLTRGSQFYDMALGNTFSYNDFSYIEYRNIHKGWYPICGYDDATIFRKKGERILYVSYSNAQCKRYNISDEASKRNFIQNHKMMLYSNFIKGNIIFESFELKAKLLDLIL